MSKYCHDSGIHKCLISCEECPSYYDDEEYEKRECKGFFESIKADARADEKAKVLAKVANLKNEYTDACNMCTRTDCDVCAISNFIDELENIMTI